MVVSWFKIDFAFGSSSCSDLYLCTFPAFNPAVALGINVFTGLYNIGYGILVTIMNLIGGLAAASCFRVIIPSGQGSATTGETTPLVA